MTKWDRRFLDMARLVGSWSKDPSTKTGAVICDPYNRVVSVGYNGYPKGVLDTEDKDLREIKYEKTIHAEVNAILHARRDLSSCRIYVSPLMPCSRCASLIIQSGITEVYCEMLKAGETVEIWNSSGMLAEQMFEEANVTFRRVLI